MSSDESYFRTIPWCANLMHDHKVFVPEARISKASGEDRFLAVTLEGNQSIEKWICLAQHPYDALIDRVRSLIVLGPGVDGYPGVCHGGLVATLMDESMSILLGINKDLRPEEERLNTLTVYLNTTYKKAVPTPSTILVEVKVVERQGRKRRPSAEMWDKETLLAKAEAMFIEIKPKL